ncbi:hypothetical protein A2U01_0076779, partial [Trifolium medium]|nr:hypothetical protein [Trifolium medium]
WSLLWVANSGASLPVSVFLVQKEGCWTWLLSCVGGCVDLWKWSGGWCLY